MRRRDFLALLGGALVAGPRIADAQRSGKIVRIGFLDTGSLSERQRLWEALRQRLRELGYIEGENITIEFRFADGKQERLPDLAAELVGRKVDVIVAAGNNATRAAKQATNTIPIVMATGGDPVLMGLVASLARPGGNVTGVTTLSTALGAKRLELLREVVPKVSRIALLYPASQAAVLAAQETQKAAEQLPVTLQHLSVRGPNEFDGAFAAIAKERAGALMVEPSPAFFTERKRLADLAMKHRLPTVFSAKEYVLAGGLIAYGSDLADGFRRAAIFVDKILKGARPADLPVEQPTTFELVINLKTAKALGLTLPQSILLRADEVIE